MRPNNPFQILVLSGGGYRGLFTAKVLEELESSSEFQLREAFDLIAGTSIGGIIACGLACGIRAGDIRKTIELEGPKIFKKRNIFRRSGIFANRYNPCGLRSAIEKVLGVHASAAISDLTAPVLVIAVSRTDAAPVIFESDPVSSSPARCPVSLIDIAMSTSAAPTYFPEHRVGTRNMIDGGIIANSADTLALMRAIGRFGRKPEEIRMISVGTATHNIADADRAARGYGAIGWLAARRLFDVTTSAQEKLSIELAMDILGDRHIRIDLPPSLAQQKAVGLDVANPVAANTLFDLAREALNRLARDDPKKIFWGQCCDRKHGGPCPRQAD